MHLLRRIERHLRQSGMTPTRFGREAVNDPRFVQDLRSGREPRAHGGPGRRPPPPPGRGIGGMIPYQNDATTALLRGLRACFGEDEALHFEEIRSRTWASATFTGARHEITLRLAGPDAPASAARFATTLGEREFALRGHVVADIALVSSEPVPDADGEPAMRLGIEALTVEDG